MNLDDIYQQIPSMKCKEGCSDCCGPVPFTDAEWEKVKDKPKRKADGSLKCQFLIDGICSIYGARPYICRIFGTTKGVELLECPHDCRPLFPLPAERSEEMTNDYMQTNPYLRPGDLNTCHI